MAAKSKVAKAEKRSGKGRKSRKPGKATKKILAKPAPSSKKAASPKTVAKAKRSAPERSGAAPKSTSPAPVRQTPAKPGHARARARPRKTAPIKLFYWPTPNGWKISIALEEMGLSYKMVPVDIRAGDQFKPAFLRIAPNNRMPAIIDPGGPGGKPISVFESGAILQYLGRKTGKFYPKEERARVEVDEWLFWQMGGLGPMAGQCHHFRQYAPRKIPYAYDRYTNEVNRLYGVMNKRLARRQYLAGEYSIADMASFGWVVPYKNQGQTLDDFPHLKRWFERMKARPAVERGMAVGAELRVKASSLKTDAKARAILFGQRAQ